ncbi:MAG: hypothetical protein AAF614_41860 [Chloroflexota bacterium]
MKQFVAWTGVYNVLLGIGFLIPPIPRLLGVKLPASSFWVLLAATFVTYLGVMLIFCARDLKARATLVYWEGILRLVAASLLCWFGFLGGLGTFLGVLGLIDLGIGLVYLVGLPKSLSTTSRNVLVDRI